MGLENSSMLRNLFYPVVFAPSMQTAKNAQKYVPKMEYVRVVDVYDGDTITVVRRRFVVPCCPKLDSFKVRLHGIDCPELRSKNDDEKKVAIMVKEHIQTMILGKVVRLTVHGYDKYGRVLANVSCQDTDISEHLLGKGFAVPYFGKTKEPTVWKDLLKEKNPEAWNSMFNVNDIRTV
jgi:endonuclease YncB( thermonuclease family)